MTILRTRSLSQAAESIHLKQATIRHRLKAMEIEPRGALIEGHSIGVDITKAPNCGIISHH